MDDEYWMVRKDGKYFSRYGRDWTTIEGGSGWYDRSFADRNALAFGGEVVRVRVKTETTYEILT